MRLTRIVVLAAIWFILFSVIVDAIEVSPTKITAIIQKDQLAFYEVTIKNVRNVTETYQISSSDTALVTPGISKIILPPQQEAKFQVILMGKEGLGYVKITDGTEVKIPVEVALTAGQQSEYLEPSFTTFQRNYEVNVKTKLRLTLRSHFAEKIEVRDLLLEDTITTQEGESKPIGVEGTLGYLQPNQDLTLDLLINTGGLEIGKTYLSKLFVVYYYKGSRYEREIDFKIGVVSGPTPLSETTQTLPQLDIVFTPTAPKVGDTLTVSAVHGTTREKITDAVIRVTEKDLATDVIKMTYVYASPFLAQLSTYCFNASKGGYKPKETCIRAALQETRIKLSPEQPVIGQSTSIAMVDASGATVSGATLTVDTATFDNPATVTFNEGRHTITGKAAGYKEAKQTVDLVVPFTYSVRENSTGIGSKLKITFNKQTAWSVNTDEEGVLASGMSTMLEFTPTKAGKYYTVANDQILTEFTVKDNSLFSIPNIPLEFQVLGVLLILGLLWKVTKKKKPRVLVGYGGGERRRPNVVDEITEGG